MFFYLRTYLLLFIMLFSSNFVFAENNIKNNIHLFNKYAKNFFLSTESDRVSYSLGVTIGKLIDNFILEKKRLGVFINRSFFDDGLNDYLNKNVKFSDKEIYKYLHIFHKNFINQQKKMIYSIINYNENLSKNFSEKFINLDGAKVDYSGLLYLIKRMGSGSIIKDSSIITVNYKCSLVDGKLIYNSYKTGKPYTFRLKNSMPGWREGLKKIHKGGLIKLAIPTHLAYGNMNIPGIPIHSMLVFEIEVLNK